MQLGPSRRTVFGAVAALFPWRRAVAEALLPQRDAEYQGMPKELQMCGTCSLFIRPDGCRVVEGPVDRRGWCKLYDPID